MVWESDVWDSWLPTLGTLRFTTKWVDLSHGTECQNTCAFEGQKKAVLTRGDQIKIPKSGEVLHECNGIRGSGMANIE